VITADLNALSHHLIGAAIEVHRALGPGLLESAYEIAFSHELSLRKIAHIRQQPIAVSYKGQLIQEAYRIDVLAENKVVIELKAVERLLPIHATQVLTYLKLGRYPLGLLINFHSQRLVDGIERVSNNAPNLPAKAIHEQALHSLRDLREPPRPPR
jgi:GxxExxY protein